MGFHEGALSRALRNAKVGSELGTASFLELVQVDDPELNLAAAALAYAGEVYPGLDRGAYLQRLDTMARQAGAGLNPGASAVEVLSRLNVYLYQEQGFSGNRQDYGDPRNSYLNEVMDRKLGIPITLSVLYLELAWRLGLSCNGVGFPGHFLIQCAVGEGHAVLDPFNAGASLGEEDLARMAAQALGRDRFDRDRLGELLVASDRRSILARMLRNLKLIHLSRSEHEDALRVVNCMLGLDPSSAADQLDRARIYDAMGAMRAALADYRACVDSLPQGPYRESVLVRIEALKGQVSRLN